MWDHSGDGEMQSFKPLEVYSNASRAQAAAWTRWNKLWETVDAEEDWDDAYNEPRHRSNGGLDMTLHYGDDVNSLGEVRIK